MDVGAKCCHPRVRRKREDTLIFGGWQDTKSFVSDTPSFSSLWGGSFYIAQYILIL